MPCWVPEVLPADGVGVEGIRRARVTQHTMGQHVQQRATRSGAPRDVLRAAATNALSDWQLILTSDPKRLSFERCKPFVRVCRKWLGILQVPGGINWYTEAKELRQECCSANARILAEKPLLAVCAASEHPQAKTLYWQPV